MQNDLFEIEKRKLQEHYSRLLRCHPEYKLLHLKFIWQLIHKSILFASITDDMKSKQSFWSYGNSIAYTSNQPLPDDHSERVVATYFALDILLKSSKDLYILHDLGKKYNPDAALNNRIKDFDIFNDLFLEEFVFYLLNQSDKNNISLGLLKKYKQRTEWFNRETLFESVSGHTSKAERLLKKDLHIYLSDQGLEITIEPVSPGGEADFIGVETSGLIKSVIEVKIFDALSRTKAKIISGFRQLTIYMNDHDVSNGFFVIYNISPQSVSFISHAGTLFPFVTKENKTIFFVIIDIFPHSEPASKRKDTGSVEFKEGDFL